MTRTFVLKRLGEAIGIVDSLRTRIVSEGRIENADDQGGDVVDELDQAFAHLTTAESFASVSWGSEDDPV